MKSKIGMAETHPFRVNGCHKSHFIQFSTFGTCLLRVCTLIAGCCGATLELHKFLDHLADSNHLLDDF